MSFVAAVCAYGALAIIAGTVIALTTERRRR